MTVVAVSSPMLTAPLTATARSGSTKGTRPAETASTVDAFTSTPTTGVPCIASAAAVGRPM